MVGLRPNEIADMELWQYNAFVEALQERQKQNTINAIMIGYYTAYYMNGGKKAKKPNELIKDMNNKKQLPQSFEQGLLDIERIMEFGN